MIHPLNPTEIILRSILANSILNMKHTISQLCKEGNYDGIRKSEQQIYQCPIKQEFKSRFRNVKH